MFMRISSIALIAALGGCTSGPAIDDKVSSAKTENQIECTIGGARDFTATCAFERGDGNILILRHADGGFRRLTLDADGLIDTADGAEAVSVQTLSDGRSEVSVNNDRYRLPATL
jgi:hypothetical protein